MIRYYGGVREVAREISSAANGVLNAYRDGQVTEEPKITERIIGAIEDRIGGKRPDGEARPYDRGATSPLGATGASDRLDEGDDADAPYPVSHRINWTARSLRTGSGIAAEERRHGADLMGIVDIDIPQFRVVKGFWHKQNEPSPDGCLRTGTDSKPSARRCFLELRIPSCGSTPRPRALESSRQLPYQR